MIYSALQIIRTVPRFGCNVKNDCPHHQSCHLWFVKAMTPASQSDNDMRKKTVCQGQPLLILCFSPAQHQDWLGRLHSGTPTEQQCCQRRRCCWGRSGCGQSLGPSARTAGGEPGWRPHCMWLGRGRACRCPPPGQRSRCWRGTACTHSALQLGPAPAHRAAPLPALQLPAPAHHSTR